MNKIYLLLIVAFLFSCDGFFRDEFTEYRVINNEQEVIDLLNGVYYHLVEVHNDNYLEALTRADDVNSYNGYFSGNGHGCKAGGGFNPQTTREIYLNLYKAILNINRLFSETGEICNDRIKGELYFLRAYCYFKLARFFGTPPLVVDIDVNYLLEKPTYQEVYEFIEADMIKALEFLPETYSEARIPRETPHAGMAKALLAEIYLAMAGFPLNDESKYAEAARYAGEVIDQAEFYDYGLLDDMANLWKVKHRHNKENIFGLFFNTRSEQTHNRFSNTRVDKGWDDIELTLRGGYNSEFRFYKTYPDNYRKYTSFVAGRYYALNHDTLDGYETSLKFIPYDPLKDPCDYIEYTVSKKFLDIEAYNLDFSRQNKKNEVTLYLYRYAHTLLTYAEAKTRSGHIDASCFEAVNMIRRRANNLDIHTTSDFDLSPDLTTEQFLDSLVWERAWELCLEPEGRWFDIIRLDLRNKLADYRYDTETPTEIPPEYLNEDWYFFRIPIHDRNQNPNFSDVND